QPVMASLSIQAAAQALGSLSLSSHQLSASSSRVSLGDSLRVSSFRGCRLAAATRPSAVVAAVRCPAVVAAAAATPAVAAAAGKGKPKKKVDSAVKRAKQAEARRVYNKSRKTEMSTRMKKAFLALEELRKSASPSEEQLLAAEKLISEAFSIIDRSVKVNAIHENKGARRKARLSRAKRATLVSLGCPPNHLLLPSPLSRPHLQSTLGMIKSEKLAIFSLNTWVVWCSASPPRVVAQPPNILYTLRLSTPPPTPVPEHARHDKEREAGHFFSQHLGGAPLLPPRGSCPQNSILSASLPRFPPLQSTLDMTKSEKLGILSLNTWVMWCTTSGITWHKRTPFSPLTANSSLSPPLQSTLDMIKSKKLGIFSLNTWVVHHFRHLVAQVNALEPEMQALTDKQIVGGAVLHAGAIAEMKTGEGKTLVSTLAAYLNALVGKGVHVVTVNDYLARRDAEWMGRVHGFLGLSVGVIQPGQTKEERQLAYACDITYGSNNEIGFDYLRDHLVQDPSERTLRWPDALHYSIVDEIDSVLIDEGRNPLLISNMSSSYVMRFPVAAKVAEILRRDIFTGRTADMRRWSDGIHQAVEAKEGVEIKPVSETVAQVTYQSLFRLYSKVSGMTGTAKTEEEEFKRIFGMPVVVIPTNRPNIRKDLDVVVFLQARNKVHHVIQEIVKMNQLGRPVLVGTSSVDESERLYAMLQVEHPRRFAHIQVLNARPENAAREAEIVAQAGRFGGITISTNMAGRGTDIVLGGNPELLSKEVVKWALFEAPAATAGNYSAFKKGPHERQGFWPIELQEDTLKELYAAQFSFELQEAALKELDTAQFSSVTHPKRHEQRQGFFLSQLRKDISNSSPFRFETRRSVAADWSEAQQQAVLEQAETLALRPSASPGTGGEGREEGWEWGESREDAGAGVWEGDDAEDTGMSPLPWKTDVWGGGGGVLGVRAVPRSMQEMVVRVVGRALGRVSADCKAHCREEGEYVRSLGGLHVIGTALSESRRIDNQVVRAVPRSMQEMVVRVVGRALGRVSADCRAHCREEGEYVRSLGGLHVIGTALSESRRIDNQRSMQEMVVRVVGRALGRVSLDCKAHCREEGEYVRSLGGLHVIVPRSMQEMVVRVVRRALRRVVWWGEGAVLTPVPYPIRPPPPSLGTCSLSLPKQHGGRHDEGGGTRLLSSHAGAAAATTSLPHSRTPCPSFPLPPPSPAFSLPTSMEDDMMREVLPDSSRAMLEQLLYTGDFDEGFPHMALTLALVQTQKIIEAAMFERRRQMLDYDQVFEVSCYIL
ncbi:unnamed protein product, partial [Closterium sp. Yama58-4]